MMNENYFMVVALPPPSSAANGAAVPNMKNLRRKKNSTPAFAIPLLHAEDSTAVISSSFCVVAAIFS